MSTNSSQTRLDLQGIADPAVLEKVESKTARGEYSPAHNASPASSVIDKLEEGRDGREPISHRPTGFRWFLLMFAFLVGLFLFSLDNTIVADVQPAIVNEFQSVDKISWLATGFFLPTTALVLAFGRFSMIFPAKWFYIASVFIFEGGSALCGGAPNMNALIVGRVLAGIGAVGIYTGALFLISVNTTEEERPKYIGMTGAMWGLGTVLGPVIGGAFTNSGATWRWAFYINLPIGALVAPILFFLIPPFDAMKGTSLMGRLRKIDWIGFILMVGCITSLVLALQYGGNLYPWNSGQVIGLFVTFGVTLIIFAFTQTMWMPGQTKERRLFPVEMIFMRTTFLLFILVATCTTTCLIAIYYIPLYFQFTRGDDALKAAVRLLPVVFTLVFSCVAGGFALAKVGYYYPFYIIGGVLGLTGSATLWSVDLHTSAANIYGFSILVGLGTGLYSQAGFAVAQATVPVEDLAAATGFIALGQLVGPTIALAIAGTVFINTGTSGLQRLLPDTPVDQIQNALAGTAGHLLDTLDPATRTAALEVIVGAISKVYILSITAAGVSVVCALLLKREKIVVKA